MACWHGDEEQGGISAIGLTAANKQTLPCVTRVPPPCSVVVLLSGPVKLLPVWTYAFCVVSSVDIRGLGMREA